MSAPISDKPTPNKPVTCQMNTSCADPVTHLDQNGFVYCTGHGIQQRAYRPCRKLRPHELSRLKRGEQVTRY